MVPSGRRGSSSSESRRRESSAAHKGQVAATWYGDDSPHPRSAPRVTGNAGENCQHAGEMGGSSPWTRPSAPECGDTLNSLAGDQRPTWDGDRPRRRLPGGHRLGHRPVVLLHTETAQCTVRPTKGQVRCCGPQLERSRP